LLDRLELPSGIVKRPLGDLRLHGKESGAVLYAVEKLPMSQAGLAA